MIWQFIILGCIVFLTKQSAKRSDLACASRRLVPVYDVFTSNVHIWLAPWYWVSDIMVNLMIVLAGIAMYDSNSVAVRLDTLLNKFIVFGIIRMICVSVTYGYVSKRYANGLHSTNEMLANCYFSDLVISGHTGFTYLLMYDVMYCQNLWQKILAVWLGVCQVYVNLAIGDHYTSDVVLAIFITFLIHTCIYLN